MRVLHLIPTLFTPDGSLIGGAERYALELARHMAREVETRLVSFGERDRVERVGELTVRVIGGGWKVRGQANNPVSPALLGEIARADVVHCFQQHVVMSSLTALVGRALRKRVFVTDLGGGGWDLSAYVSTDAWFHGHLHISEYSRRVFGQEGNPRAEVILGGVDAEKFSPGEPGRARDGVVFVGRLLPHKGVDYLVRAVPADMPLEIIGRAHDPRYLALLTELAEGKRVTFRQSCDDAEMIEAYRGATCVVLPSVYTTVYGESSTVPELLGQTLLEGMACGAAAVCTDVASMPEVVEDGRTGFVVPPNDPDALAERLRWLRDRPGEAAAMGAAGRERVLSRFTWPVVVRRCLAAYGGR